VRLDNNHCCQQRAIGDLNGVPIEQCFGFAQHGMPSAAVLSPVSFIDAGEFASGSCPRFVATGDFCVGLPDLAVVNSASNDVSVLINSTM